jgi:two-component system OmpR family response regulator
MRILLIEDDNSVADFIVRGFKEAGHTIDHADNGKDGLFMATTESYDVLIVDRMLPGVDGLSITRTLRASDDNTPVLILSALGQVDDRVKGLQAGGTIISSSRLRSANWRHASRRCLGGHRAKWRPRQH